MKNKIKVSYMGRYININKSAYGNRREMVNAWLAMAEQVNMFGSIINHKYNLGDCLLCKFNLINKNQIRKNPYFKEKK